MKKSKILVPILAATTAMSLVPMAVLTSCNKDNETNKVYLHKGYSATQTVTQSTKLVRYKFVQKNINNAQDTKVYISNFKVNGVDHKTWTKTFTYSADSAGNIVVNIYTQNIVKSVANVSSFSFNLVFKNKKANTEYAYGPFEVKFDEGVTGEAKTESVTLNFQSVNGDPTVGNPAMYKVTAPEGESGFTPYEVKTISLLNDTNGQPLQHGTDFSYTRSKDGKTAYIYIKQFPSAGIDFSTSVEGITTSDHNNSLYEGYYESPGEFQMPVLKFKWFGENYDTDTSYTTLSNVSFTDESCFFTTDAYTQDDEWTIECGDFTITATAETEEEWQATKTYLQSFGHTIPDYIKGRVILNLSQMPEENTNTDTTILTWKHTVNSKTETGSILVTPLTWSSSGGGIPGDPTWDEPVLPIEDPLDPIPIPLDQE